jgi:hypothetical protein
MYDNVNYKLGITCQLSNLGACPKFRCRSAADAVSAHQIPLPSGAAKSGQGIDFDDIVDAASEHFRDANE